MSSPAERLASVLETGVVRVDFEAESFERAVHDLLVPALLSHGIGGERLDTIVDAVLTRERTGSTCAGPLALPHARVAGVPEIICGLGVNRRGIYPDAGVRFMIAFVSPQEATADHLRFLSEAARAFRSQALLDGLADAATPGDAIEVIRSAQR